MAQKRILKLAITIITLVAIVGGLWWQMHNSDFWNNFKEDILDESEKGMIYRDDNYGFSFRYPIEFLPKENRDEDGNIIFSSGDGRDSLSVRITEDSLLSLMNQRRADGLSVDQGDILVGDKLWHKFSMGDAGCGGVVYYMSFGKNTLIVQFSSCESATVRDWYIIDEKNHEQILNSFVLEDEGFRIDIESCVPAGCSGQLCLDENEAGDIATTCEYRAEYACYQNAKCERQASGECGWTQTLELRSCLQNPPPLQ